MAADHLLLVDGTNILVRGQRAIERVPLSTTEGQPTGALLVFINTLARYVREVAPTRIMVCFDGGGSAFRTLIYPAYKADRTGSSTDQPLILQVDNFLEAAGIPYDRRGRVEADDLIASYVMATPTDTAITILSGDKDFLQLLDEEGRIRQIRPGAGKDVDLDTWTWDRVVAVMGATPAQLPSVMALTGDAIDGIPGIRGYGTKTAVKRLGEYQWDLEALLSGNPGLFGHEDEVRRNLALVQLRDHHHPEDVQPVPKVVFTQPSHVNGYLMENFLKHYQLEAIYQRWIQGSLWDIPSNNTQALEDLLHG